MPLYQISAETFVADEPLIGPMLATGIFASMMMDQMINKDKPIADHILDEKFVLDFMLKPQPNIG